TRMGLQVAREAEKRLAGVDRIQHQSLGPRHVTHERQLLGPRERIAAAHVALENLDFTARERNGQTKATDAVLDNLATDPHALVAIRSEERRVGKKRRSWWARDHEGERGAT